MKILFISMPSIHVIRWIENLKDTEHELYWFDVINRGELNTIPSVQQFVGWKKRKLPYIKGEYFLSKKAPIIYNLLKSSLEVTENKALERVLKKIKPDIVHSFEMQSCSYPILKTMQKFPNIKWIYSCWGSDLFYYQNFECHYRKIKRVLRRIDYLHTDCQRDHDIAIQLGFSGTFSGLIPGGTGFKLKELKSHKKPVNERKIILIKGYQHLFGRALNTIKAIQSIKESLAEYEIVIFGAHSEVQNYTIEQNLGFKVYGRHDLSHQQLMELFGKSLLYIGNSISDGMPNTLLEAIAMGAFPIQSNPGGATAELISHGENGLLIQDPDDVDGIASLIAQAISSKELLLKASCINEKLATENLDYTFNQNKVIALYDNFKKLKF